MGLLSSLFEGPQLKELTVNYDQHVKIPLGADKMVWHHPAGTGAMTLRSEYFDIRPIPYGMTYLEYLERHRGETFADALVLEAMLAAITSQKWSRKWNAAISRFLGGFSGQLFFLGTAFEGLVEGRRRTCFSYLCWDIGDSALRRGCPVDNPVNHTENASACHLRLPTASLAA